MKNRVLHYLIRFLVGDELPNELVEAVGYTANPHEFEKYSVVIIPSGFFDSSHYGTTASLPTLPLPEIEGIPLLFGEPTGEWVGDTWVTRADIIASTYFLVSRYEEMVRRETRDEHGRFPGKESLPYRAGFLHRPIVDEYRQLLHRWLRLSLPDIPEPAPMIRQIYLTHDVDAPTLYRSWKGFARSLLGGRGWQRSIEGKFGAIERDPYYTFPWLFQQDELLRDTFGKATCRSLLFLRSGGDSLFDKPHYSLHSRDLNRLIHSAQEREIEIGLHSSYRAGERPSLIPGEKERLERRLGKPVTSNRHHFLACREPEDLDLLEAAGITDDFSMGYADAAGFRLGTSRPVRWINPVTRRLSPLLWLHPLTLMDCSLAESKYMGMDYERALAYSLNLAEQVYRFGGELILLWHNESVSEHNDGYLRKLYAELLNELAKNK